MTYELQHFIQHSIQFVHLMQRFAALSVIGYAIHQYTCTSNIFLYDMGCGRIIPKRNLTLHSYHFARPVGEQSSKTT